MQGFRESRLLLILATVFACLGAATLNAQDRPGEGARDPLLDTLNHEFREQYRQALAATLVQQGPVIIEEATA